MRMSSVLSRKLSRRKDDSELDPNKIRPSIRPFARYSSLNFRKNSIISSFGLNFSKKFNFVISRTSLDERMSGILFVLILH